jgi:ribosomal protein S7
MVRYSRDRNGRSMADKLANEIVAASKGEGAALKRKKIHTVWQKPTKHLHILEFNYFDFF